MSKSKLGSSFLLLLTACIWGVSFVAQSAGMKFIGPFTFNFSRFLLGGFVLIPVIVMMDRSKKKESSTDGLRYFLKDKKQRRITIIAGVCCGGALSVATFLQQEGILFTSVGKAGFITALYIIIVPMFGLFLKKKVSILVWVSALLAMFGLYLLCVKESFSINKGDIFLFACAFVFSIHILLVDYFSPKADGVIISCIQFFASGIFCGIGAFLLEHPQWSGIVAALLPILYAGIMSCGIAYTLQIVAQKNIEPSVASLIMSLESVVAALAGWLILGQKMSKVELLGCVVVFIAILLAQIPEKEKEKEPEIEIS